VEDPIAQKRSIHTAVADKMRRQRPAAASVSTRRGRSAAAVADEFDESDYEDE
jgi:hypothetical protein